MGESGSAKKKVSPVLNAPQESNHKRTEKHPVDWAGPRSSTVLTGANLTGQWEPRPPGMGGMVKWELRTHRELGKLKSLAMVKRSEIR